MNKLTFKPLKWAFAGLGSIFVISVVELVTQTLHPTYFCDIINFYTSEFYKLFVLPLYLVESACSYIFLLSIVYEQINSLLFILFQKFVDFTQLDQKRTQYNQIERRLDTA